MFTWAMLNRKRRRSTIETRCKEKIYFFFFFFFFSKGKVQFLIPCSFMYLKKQTLVRVQKLWLWLMSVNWKHITQCIRFCVVATSLQMWKRLTTNTVSSMAAETFSLCALSLNPLFNPKWDNGSKKIALLLYAILIKLTGRFQTQLQWKQHLHPYTPNTPEQQGLDFKISPLLLCVQSGNPLAFSCCISTCVFIEITVPVFFIFRHVAKIPQHLFSKCDPKALSAPHPFIYSTSSLFSSSLVTY